MKRSFLELLGDNGASHGGEPAEDVYNPYVPEPLPPEIGAGPFEYAGNEEGSGGELLANGIPRCNSDRLMYLLTCFDEFPEESVCKLPPELDESQEFYAAQLVHFGLKSSWKGKNDDKAILLEYGVRKGNRFEVPKEIAELETRLSRKWESEHRDWRLRVAIARTKQKEAAQEVLERKMRARNKRLRDACSNPGVNSTLEKPCLPLCGGVYSVLTSKLFDDRPVTLYLCFNPFRCRIWGHFDSNMMEMIFRSEKLDDESLSNSTVKFSWRGRNKATGGLTYSTKNVAEFNFLSEKTFEGTVTWERCGTFDVSGQRHVQASRRTPLGQSKIREWKRRYVQWNENWSEAEGHEDGDESSDTD